MGAREVYAEGVYAVVGGLYRDCLGETERALDLEDLGVAVLWGGWRFGEKTSCLGT